MKISVFGPSLLLICELVFTGCASTPAPVTETATHTAAMMGQLKRELKEFQVARQVSDESVVALMKSVRMNAERQRVLMNQDMRAHEAAGDTQTVQLLARLRSLSDSLRDDDVTLQEAQSKLDAKLATLLKPLPDVSSNFDSAISSVSLLGQNVPRKTQFDDTLEMLRAVWKNTKDNRDKLSQAIKAAP